MTLFLFMKQLVDMLYQYRSLDYLMVAFVLVLLVYQVALVRPNLRETFCVADAIVIALVALLTMAFLNDYRSYDTYFKILSAFLLYSVGRIYYDRIKECTGALVTASYLVVYLNLLSRVWRFGFSTFGLLNAEGDLYYYDTDMAFAMILAMVFILMYGHGTLFKYITVFGVCPFMVFCSDAGIQMVLMLVVYLITAIYIMELFVENHKITNTLLAVMVIGLLAVVGVIYLPVFGQADQNVILTLFGSRFLDHDNMYGRYDVWNAIYEGFQQRGLLGRLFGLELGYNGNTGSLYVKTLCTVGYLGSILAIAFIVNIVYYVIKVHDRKTFYVTTILVIMLLGTGVTVCSMEFTQMSWYPLMYVGMVVSSVQAQQEEKGRLWHG